MCFYRLPNCLCAIIVSFFYICILPPMTGHKFFLIKDIRDIEVSRGLSSPPKYLDVRRKTLRKT